METVECERKEKDAKGLREVKEIEFKKTFWVFECTFIQEVKEGYCSILEKVEYPTAVCSLHFHFPNFKPCTHS